MQKAVSQPSDDQFHIQAVAEEAEVELIPDPHNQRIKHTVLTERGHQLYDTHIMKMRHWEEHAWKSMDEQERIMLSELTWKLYHLIEELYLREENEK